MPSVTTSVRVNYYSYAGFNSWGWQQKMYMGLFISRKFIITQQHNRQVFINTNSNHVSEPYTLCRCISISISLKFTTWLVLTKSL